MTSSHMPPGKIALLLHYHFDPIKPDTDGNTRKWTDELLADNLIEISNRPPDPVYSEWITSKRGQAYVEMLCNTPLPIQQWIDPRSNSDG